MNKSLRIFKSEVRQLKDEDVPAGTPAAETDPVTGAPIPPVPPAPVPGTPLPPASRAPRD
ncbi:MULTISPECIES: hypothetical protein [Arthrobacter]|uniref:Uncharacterized protein n=1 Tax=Arthrobacter caoxuetaonis TaxID=2886935 RepID=A0A9X1SD82_9MICC|nr:MULTISPECIES: hypothetical protein [Arthrobacter]MCC3283299.1 hypothetical protein [Arthrobacter caoxuetaonis]MCC3298421.1 hypothetical protein [Arthrobacter caoxuetaonis]MCC9195181.1 hypothetical protein [Arthrobacter sp. zg-Y916]USQ57563.1 hypothetical protein NF551_01485 [Arthrobacter caoxuetaonis]